MKHLKPMIRMFILCVLCALFHMEVQAQTVDTVIEREIKLENLIMSADESIVHGKATLVYDREFLPDEASTQELPYCLYASIEYRNENNLIKGIGVYKLEGYYTIVSGADPIIKNKNVEATFELVHIAGEVSVPNRLSINGLIDVNGDEENGIIENFTAEGIVDAITIISDSDSSLSTSTFFASDQYTLASNDIRSGTVGTVVVPKNSRVESFVTSNFAGTKLICYANAIRFAGEIEYVLKPRYAYTDSYYVKEKLVDSGEIYNFRQFLSYVALLQEETITSDENSQLTTSKYDYVQNIFVENYKFYYSSEVAESIRNTWFVLEDDSKVKFSPDYFVGTYRYDLNGGTNHIDNISYYYLGTKNIIQSPTRKDYRFCGWYTNEDFTEDSLLAINDNGEYYLSAEQSNYDEFTIYARWEFYTIVERNGIQYQITADHTVSVLKGSSAKDVEILNVISYKGNLYPVIGILKNAFTNCDITTIKIPKNVIEIEEGAFYGSDVKEVYVDSLSLDIKDVFVNTITLYAYATSYAYSNYETMGYIGEKYCYNSSITYVLNGGVNHMDNPANYNWKSILVLYEPTKDKCRFDGWYTDSSFQKASKIEQIYEDRYDDIILYAKFTPIEIDVEEEMSISLPYMEEEGNSTASKVEENLSSIKKPYIKKFSLKNIKGNKLKITIKAYDAQGYQIKYSTNKNLKNAKTLSFKKNSYTKKLKKNKTYYVKVRAYIKNNEGKKIYSDWTKVKKITIKK